MQVYNTRFTFFIFPILRENISFPAPIHCTLHHSGHPTTHIALNVTLYKPIHLTLTHALNRPTHSHLHITLDRLILLPHLHTTNCRISDKSVSWHILSVVSWTMAQNCFGWYMQFHMRQMKAKKEKFWSVAFRLRTPPCFHLRFNIPYTINAACT